VSPKQALFVCWIKTSQPELIATPQFDSGRWKWRLERIPVSADKQFNESSARLD
jgi:hypothetical protein